MPRGHSILDSILNRPSQTYTAPDPETPTRRAASRQGWTAPSDLPNAPGSPNILSGSMFNRKSGTTGRSSRANSVAGGGSLRGFGRSFGRSRSNSVADDNSSTVAGSVAGSSTARKSRWWDAGSLRGFGRSSRTPSIAGDSVFSEPEPAAPGTWDQSMAGIGAGTKTRQAPRSDFGGSPSAGVPRSGSSNMPPLPRHDAQALRAMNANASPGRLPSSGVAPLGKQPPSLVRTSPSMPLGSGTSAMGSQAGSASGSVSGRSRNRLSAVSNPNLSAAAAASASPVRKRHGSGGPASTSQDWKAFINSMQGTDTAQAWESNSLQAVAVRAASPAPPAEPLARRRSTAAARVQKELEQDALFEQAQRDPGVIHQDLIARAAQQVIGQSLPPQAMPVSEAHMSTVPSNLRPGSVILDPAAAALHAPTSIPLAAQPAPQPQALDAQALALQQHAQALAIQQHAQALQHHLPPGSQPALDQHTLALQQHAQAHAQALQQTMPQVTAHAQPARSMSPPPRAMSPQPPRPMSAASLNRDLPPTPTDGDSSGTGESGSDESSEEESSDEERQMLDVVAEEDEEGSSNAGHEMRPHLPSPVKHSAFEAAIRKTDVSGSSHAGAAQRATAVTPAISVDEPARAAAESDDSASDDESIVAPTAAPGAAGADADAPLAVSALLSAKQGQSGAPSAPSARSLGASSKVRIAPDATGAEGSDDEAASDDTSRGAPSMQSRPPTLRRRLSDLSLGGSLAMSAMLRGSVAGGASRSASSRQMRMRDSDSDSAGEAGSGDDAELKARARADADRLRNLKVGEEFFGESLTGLLDRFGTTNWSDSTIDRLGLDLSAAKRQSMSAAAATEPAAASSSTAGVPDAMMQVRQERADAIAAGSSGAAETRSLESALAPSIAAAWLLGMGDDNQSMRSRRSAASRAHRREESGASAVSASSSDKTTSPTQTGRFRSLFSTSARSPDNAAVAAPPRRQSVMDRPRATRAPQPDSLGGVPISHGRLEAESPSRPTAKASGEDLRSTLPASMSSALLASPTQRTSSRLSSSSTGSTPASPEATASATLSKDKPAPAKSALKPLRHSKSLADTLFSFGPSKEEKREKKAKAKAASFASGKTAGGEVPASPPSAWAKKDSKIAKAERKAERQSAKAAKPAETPAAAVAAAVVPTTAKSAETPTSAAAAPVTPVAAKSAEVPAAPAAAPVAPAIAVPAAAGPSAARAESVPTASAEVPARDRPLVLPRSSSIGPVSPGIMSETDGEERWESADEGNTPFAEDDERSSWLSAPPQQNVATGSAALDALSIPGALPSLTSDYMDARADVSDGTVNGDDSLASNGTTMGKLSSQFHTARDLAAAAQSPEKAPALPTAASSATINGTASTPVAPVPLVAQPAPLLDETSGSDADSEDESDDDVPMQPSSRTEQAAPSIARDALSPPPSSELWSGSSAASTVLSTPGASDILLDRKPLAERRSDSSPSRENGLQLPAPEKRLPMPPAPSFEDSVAMPPLHDDATPLAVPRAEPSYGSLITPRADRPEPNFGTAVVNVNLIPPTPPALETRTSFGASRPPAESVGSLAEDVEEQAAPAGAMQRSPSQRSKKGEPLSRSASTNAAKRTSAPPAGYQLYQGKGLSLPPGMFATTVASSSQRRSSEPDTAAIVLPDDTVPRRKKSKKSSSKSKTASSGAAQSGVPPVPLVPEQLRRGSDAGSEIGSGSNVSAANSMSRSASPSPSVSAPGSVVSSAAGSAVSSTFSDASSRGGLQASQPRKIRTLSAGPSGQARTAVMSAISEWESSPISMSPHSGAPSPGPLPPRPLSAASGPYMPQDPGMTAGSYAPSMSSYSMASQHLGTATRSNSSIVSGVTPAMVRDAPLGSSTDTYLPVPRSRLSVDGRMSPALRMFDAPSAPMSVDGHSRDPYAESFVSRDSSPSASQSAMSLPSVPMSSYRPRDPMRASNTIDDRLYARTTMNTISVSSGAFRSSSRSSKRNSIDAAQGTGAVSGRASMDAVPEQLQEELSNTKMALTAHTPPPRKISSTQVLCQIIAVSIDELDRMLLREKVRADSAYGFVPGRSFCGRVMETGWEVKRMRKGDVVFGLQSSRKCGALAEFMVIQQDLVAKAPEDCLTTEQIAALPSTGVMAYQLMTNHASQLARGARVLILNAHDGIGLLTMQGCAPLGLIIVAHCPESVSDGVAVCEANGAHEVVIGEPLWALNSLHESSFDLVIDTIGGRRVYDAARRILAHDGQFATCYGDEHNTANPNLRSHLRSLKRSFFKKDRKNIGYEWVGADQGEDCREALEAVRAAAEAGDICPRLRSILTFSDAPRAFDAVIRGADEEPGAIVVRVS